MRDFWLDAYEKILPLLSMSTTVEQTQTEMQSRGSKVFSDTHECIPLIAIHQNPKNFLGYSDVCTLSSIIIHDFELSFEGLNIFRNGEIVGKYETWQEGYQSEFYSRDKISFGSRLQMKTSFLKEVCRRYNKILCNSTSDVRAYFESRYKSKPDEVRHTDQYVIYHL